MLQWPHSGFQVHTGVGVPEEDRAFALRMTYDPAIDQVTYRSDKAAGPTAGTATVDLLEFLARLVTHIPDKGQVMQRYYGWYASRTRGAAAASGTGTIRDRGVRYQRRSRRLGPPLRTCSPRCPSRHAGEGSTAQ